MKQTHTIVEDENIIKKHIEKNLVFSYNKNYKHNSLNYFKVIHFFSI